MLPWVYEFRWEPWHLVFLGAFMVVGSILLLTLFRAFLRSTKDLRTGRAANMQWEAAFESLPERARTCRHEFSGEFSHRVCVNRFQCDQCATHKNLTEAAPGRSRRTGLIPLSVAGIPIRPDRYHHRGHTWVHREAGGTLKIGIDELGKRLVGRPDAVEYPTVGKHLMANGTAWSVRKDGQWIKMLSPVEGEVVGINTGEGNWVLRVRPTRNDLSHLLHGKEVSVWMMSEVERLQQLLTAPEVGVTLPDGGLVVDDLAQAAGSKIREVRDEMFLAP